MSRLNTALKNDYAALCFVRDELALQISLLQSDLKDRWLDLEQKMDHLREQMGRVEVVAEKSARDIDASAKSLIELIRTGYDDIKRALKQNMNR
jgi:hypothetical protein